MQNTRQNKKAFTLVELIISVTIIAILAGVSLTTLRTQSGNARDAKRKADLEQMRTALEFYRRSNNNSYPNTFGRGNVYPDNTKVGWLGECTGYDDPNVTATGFIPGLSPQFIPQLPRDPNTGTNHTSINSSCTTGSTCYLYKSDGTDFKLLAHCTLEQAPQLTDPFYDPRRPDWALQVSSSQAVRGGW